MKPVLALLAAAALSACAAPSPQIRPLPVVCPAVPACVKPALPLETNADLARAYLETSSAFDRCAAARDALMRCIGLHNGNK